MKRLLGIGCIVVCFLYGMENPRSLQPNIKKEITQEKNKWRVAASFLEAFVYNKLIFMVDPYGRKTIAFRDLKIHDEHELLLDDITKIMNHVHVVIKDHFNSAQLAWKQLQTNPDLDLSDEQEYLVMVYLYKYFMDGYDICGLKIPSEIKYSNLKKNRREYQKLLQRYIERGGLKVSEYKERSSMKLHPYPECPLFVTRVKLLRDLR